jgi:hypothetical protein
MKKCSIVFVETGEHGGKGFNVYMEGAKEEWNGMTPEEALNKLSPSEFWCLRCFQICACIMEQTGVMKESHRPS